MAAVEGGKAPVGAGAVDARKTSNPAIPLSSPPPTSRSWHLAWISMDYMDIYMGRISI
jgi:hypothetical protein